MSFQALLLTVICVICCVNPSVGQFPSYTPEKCQGENQELWDALGKKFEENKASWITVTTSHGRMLTHLFAWGFRENQLTLLIDCISEVTGLRPLTSSEWNKLHHKKEIYNVLPYPVRIMMDNLALRSTTLKQFTDTYGLEGLRSELKDLDLPADEAENILEWAAKWEDHEALLKGIADEEERQAKAEALIQQMDYQQPRWMEFHRNVISEVAAFTRRRGDPIATQNQELYSLVHDLTQNALRYQGRKFGGKVVVLGGFYLDLIPFDLFQHFASRIVVEPATQRSMQEFSSYVLSKSSSITMDMVQFVPEDVTLRATPMADSIRSSLHDVQLRTDEAQSAVLEHAASAMRLLPFGNSNSPRNIVSLRKADVVILNMIFLDLHVPFQKIAFGMLQRIFTKTAIDLPEVLQTFENFCTRFSADSFYLRQALQRDVILNIVDSMDKPNFNPNAMIVVLYVNASSSLKDPLSLHFPNEFRPFGKDGPLLRGSSKYHYTADENGVLTNEWVQVVVDVYRRGGNDVSPPSASEDTNDPSFPTEEELAMMGLEIPKEEL
eukprot:PhF_6_TR21147/c0_g1_i1/m.30426